ncbi:lysophospholipase L1-like esterase [Nocardioides cavernae]|uniref:Lysophospholipase L1-like esterase n=1 Tax=Nocardioides cavernae TaxID=1921566 RepID=A0A7Y9H566_9ACTN|nr:SGNH/GDSL hydrolase family protein [Nocardioides cavernae]NYE38136.1 lysophospholipase L1-like esterase [Nocardioides cavernae]
MSSTPASSAQPPALRLAVLGDSIAWGQGAATPDDRLAPRLTGALRARGLTVADRVFAEPGARSRDLGAQVDRALTWRPHVALVVIGANDVTHREPVQAAAAALEQAVRRLRGSGSEVVVAPAPDLGAVPHVPAALRQVVRAASETLRRRQADAVVAAGGRVADADQRASQAFGSDPALFSADRFHPSSAGYAVIADAVLPALDLAVRSAARAQGPAGPQLP